MGIRVLIAEDSPTLRHRLAEVLAEAQGIEVVGEASDGREAVELCQRLRPDVLTMDMMMPVMTGLAAVEQIMAFCPTPILIVSASVNRGELFRTYDALAAGAVDVLEKPLGDEPPGLWEQKLIGAVRMVARIRVITHPRARLARLPQRPSPSPPPPSPPGAEPGPVIGIGASTGGPGAVLTVLRELPANFGAPILLVIHISEPFGQALADWLDSQVPLSVRYAVDGEALPERGVRMAPPGVHLELEGRRLRLTRGPERHSCRPSVDVLFESLHRTSSLKTVGCLLTGMGRDGAAGLLGIRRAGGFTIAQDERTSVVYGMPGEAVKLGAATHVLAITEIGPLLRTLVPPRGGP